MDGGGGDRLNAGARTGPARQGAWVETAEKRLEGSNRMLDRGKGDDELVMIFLI